MSLKEELEQIRAAHDGLLRPVDVVEFARNPETDLHGEFEWDDAVAAHEHRLRQAREIIRTVVMVHPQVSEPIRVYVSLEPDRLARGGGYRTIDDVMENAEYRERLLQQARRDMELFRMKYAILGELAAVFDAMEDAVNLQARQGVADTER